MNDTLSIESVTGLVRQRQTDEALLAIRKLLKSNSDPNFIFQVCEWYWAMGRPRDAFLLLQLHHDFPSRQSGDSHTGRRLLWGARFLNNLGASKFAIDLAQIVVPTNSEHHWILGNIFHSNRYDSEALHHFEKMGELTENRHGRFERFRLMVKASTLAALNRTDEAVSLLEDTLAETAEPQLHGHMQLFLGSILTQAGRYTEALPVLREAETKLAFISDLPDFGVLCKCMGLSLCSAGEMELGTRYFDRAEKLLFTEAFRPEIWLDLILQRSKVMPVSPDVLSRLRHYPGYTPGLQAHFGVKDLCSFGSSEAPIKILLGSDEYFLEGRWRLGIPKELMLLAMLAIVGTWGINSIRAQSQLWPEEVFSFVQLGERMKKLIKRLRDRYGIDILFSEGHLKLAEPDQASVYVESGGRPEPTFLSTHNEMRLSDLERAYSVSKTQASLYLQKLINSGIVSRQGQGRSTTYLVNTKADQSGDLQRECEF